MSVSSVSSDTPIVSQYVEVQPEAAIVQEKSLNENVLTPGAMLKLAQSTAALQANLQGLQDEALVQEYLKLAAGNAPIEQEIQKLVDLKIFAKNPSWEAYQKLDPTSIYLIAGRYIYLQNKWLWMLSSKSILETEFAELYQAGKQKPKLFLKAVQEAIASQEKIVYLELCRDAFVNGKNLRKVERLNPAMHQEFTQYLVFRVLEAKDKIGDFKEFQLDVYRFAIVLLNKGYLNLI